MEPIPNVLMIAYYFPPMGGVGVQRTLKFVKFLPEFGWHPHILTAQGRTGLCDNSLEGEVPESTPITRTHSLHLPHQLPWRLRNFIARWLLIVDEQIGWLPFATSAGKRLLAKNGGIKVIYSTSAPYTAHLIARHLHEQTKLPWVADFRDPWVENPYIGFPTPFHRGVNQHLEANIFAEAERIILNTERAHQVYLQKYPKLPSEKLVCIPNGYDPADIPLADQEQSLPESFTIVHLGSLSARSRSSKYFLQAVRSLIQAGKIPAEKLRIRLIGSIDHEAGRLAGQLGLEGIVVVQGYLPHRQALEQLSAASLLLLIPSYGPGEELFIPAKLYEYLALRKPILCLAEAGGSANLILRTCSGWVVTPKNTAGITEKLAELYQAWEQGVLAIHPDQSLIASFERRKLTEMLAGVFDQVAR